MSNDDIIIESFNDSSLMQQDIHEKENKTSDLNHCLEILSEGSELKLNGINNQITSILSITSPHLIKLTTIALGSVPVRKLTK